MACKYDTIADAIQLFALQSVVTPEQEYSLTGPFLYHSMFWLRKKDKSTHVRSRMISLAR